MGDHDEIEIRISSTNTEWKILKRKKRGGRAPPLPLKIKTSGLPNLVVSPTGKPIGTRGREGSGNGIYVSFHLK